MSQSHTAEERAELVLKAAPEVELSKDQQRQLGEVIYTLSEAGEIDHLRIPDAVRFWSLVEMARNGLVTDDMKL